MDLIKACEQAIETINAVNCAGCEGKFKACKFCLSNITKMDLQKLIAAEKS